MLSATRARVCPIPSAMHTHFLKVCPFNSKLLCSFRTSLDRQVAYFLHSSFSTISISGMCLFASLLREIFFFIFRICFIYFSLYNPDFAILLFSSNNKRRKENEVVGGNAHSKIKEYFEGVLLIYTHAPF